MAFIASSVLHCLMESRHRACLRCWRSARQEEPEVEVRFFEVPLAQQIKGLCGELYDLGFAQSDEVGEGIIAVPVWSDPLMVAVPAQHPLLSTNRFP